jgi:hypothetical protein
MVLDDPQLGGRVVDLLEDLLTDRDERHARGRAGALGLGELVDDLLSRQG